MASIETFNLETAIRGDYTNGRTSERSSVTYSGASSALCAGEQARRYLQMNIARASLQPLQSVNCLRAGRAGRAGVVLQLFPISSRD